MIKVELVDYYDVWGNAEDGYEVNNISRDGTFELENLEDETIIEKLKEIHYLNENATPENITVDDYYPYMEILESNGYPLGRLEVVK